MLERVEGAMVQIKKAEGAKKPGKRPNLVRDDRQAGGVMFIPATPQGKLKAILQEMETTHMGGGVQTLLMVIL